MTERNPDILATVPDIADGQVQTAVEHGRKWPRRFAAGLAIGAVVFAGGKFMQHRIEATKLGCDAEIIVDGQAVQGIHLPDGSSMFGTATTNGMGLTVSMGGFSDTLTPEEVKTHPTLRFDATEDTAVQLHVTEKVVTASCEPLKAIQ
jgi:hypothetical protein